MYSLQDDIEDVKKNSCEPFLFRTLSATQRMLLNGLFTFLEQGNTFRDCSYKNKIEIIGNRIESTEYQLPVHHGYEGKDTSKNRGKSENSEECRKKSARRAKGNFVNKVDSTFAFVDKKFPQLFTKGWRLRFLTLTYKEEMENRSQLAQDWAKFEKRVKTYFITQGLCSELELQDIHYIAVPEIQKQREQKTGKRVWHLHILIFSPYLSVREIYKVWGFGGLLPKKVNLDQVKTLGGYLAKYMDKDFEEGAFNKKRFFSSRNVRVYKIRFAENVKHLQNILSMFARYAVETKPFTYLSDHLGIISGCVLLLARTDEVYQFLKFWTG
jgi:hypothetical protein